MLWIKVFHIFFVVSWFAGLFYLPRIFVNHAMVSDEATCNQLKLMERKLYRFVTPMMLLSIIFGFWIISYNPQYYFSSGWMQAKIALVAVLVGYHLYCGRLVKTFANDENRRSHVFYRLFNEFPVFLLLACIILVVVKPF